MLQFLPQVSIITSGMKSSWKDEGNMSMSLLMVFLKVSKEVFIIYTRGWYRREMGWISHFSGV